MHTHKTSISNLHAVSDARAIGFSCPRNCFFTLELKQPIYWRIVTDEEARLDKRLETSFTTIDHQTHLNLANYMNQIHKPMYKVISILARVNPIRSTSPQKIKKELNRNQFHIFLT